MVGLSKSIVLAAVLLVGTASAGQFSRSGLTAEALGLSPRALAILDVLERRTDALAEIEMSQRNSAPHSGTRSGVKSSSALDTWPWDEGHSDGIPRPRYSPNVKWLDWKKWRKTAQSRTGFHWLIGQWLKHPNKRSELPKSFIKRMDLMAPDSQTKEELAKFYRESIQWPEMATWPDWILLPYVPSSSTYEDLSRWVRTAEYREGKHALAGIWVNATPQQRLQMPSDFQAEMKRVETLGQRFKKKLTLKSDYEKEHPLKRHPSEPWPLWEMIGERKRKNRMSFKGAVKNLLKLK